MAGRGYPLLLSLLSLLLPLLALAQPDSDKARAKARYEEAERHFKLQEYEEALAGYKDAYRLSGKPELLFNVAQCQRQLGRHEEALKSYKTFLADVPKTPVRAEVEKVIAELEELVAKEKAAQPPQPDPLPASAPALTPETPDAPEGSRAPRLLFAGAGVTGGAGLVVGALALRGGLEANRLAGDETIPTSEVREALTRAERLGWGANALLLGGAALGGAGYLLSRRAPETRLALLPGAGGFLLQLQVAP